MGVITAEEEIVDAEIEETQEVKEYIQAVSYTHLTLPTTRCV